MPRKPDPTPTAFAWDLILDGNMAEESGYDFPTQHAATVAALRAFYAWFERRNELVPKDLCYTLSVVSRERKGGDENADPVVEEFVHDFGVPWLIRDNEGATADRYTIYFTDGSYLGMGDAGDCYGWGETYYRKAPGTPDVDDDAAWLHVGKKVAWAELPDDVRAAVLAKMRDSVDYYERDNAPPTKPD